mgnify:CR=1 FL=1
MNKHLKNIVIGVGSVLDLAPEPTARRLVPQGSDYKRLGRDLYTVGMDMRKVLNRAKHDARRTS